MYLSRNGDHEKLREIINKMSQRARGGILSEGYPDNTTPMHRAAENGYKDVVKMLVDGDADKDKLDDYGHSPLYYAASSNHVEVCQYLLTEAHAKLTCTYNKKDDNKVVVTVHKESPFHRACAKGYLPIVQAFVDAGADLNHTISDFQLLFGDSPMHRAAGEGKVDVVKFLTEVGARLDIIDNDGNSPLHRAAYLGYLPVVEFLVQRGADLDAKNGAHETPRDMARRGNSIDVDRFLR